MIYVYTTNLLNGACEIAKAIDGELLRKFDGMNFVRKGQRVKFDPNDSLICWGACAPEMDGVKIVNGIEPINSAKLHRDLSGHGYQSIESFPYSGNPNKKSSGIFGSGFLPRSNESREGNDILTIPVTTPRADLWAPKWNFTHEWAVFVMGGKILNVGLKRPNHPVSLTHEGWMKVVAGGGKMSHPIVKTPMGGWSIDLNHETSETDLTQIKQLAKIVMNIYSPDFAQINIGYSKDVGMCTISVSLSPHVQNKDVLDLYVEGFVKMFKPVKVKVVEVEAKEPKEPKVDLKMKKKLMRKAARISLQPPLTTASIAGYDANDLQENLRRFMDNQTRLLGLAATHGVVTTGMTLTGNVVDA